MLSVTPSRSRVRLRGPIRRLALVLIGLVALASVSLTTLAALVTTDRYIVTAEDVVDEDVYVTSVSSTVEGVIDGDLTIFTGDLTITGEVTGSVTVFSSGSVVIGPTGTVGGSLNGVAVRTTIEGTIAGDIFLAAPSVVISESGSIDRDAMLFGGTARVEGSVSRDLRGRTFRLVIDGEVGGDVDVASQKLEFGPEAVVGGDVLYRSPREASGTEGVSIGGTLTRLPAQSNFVYGIILALANIVGFFGFLVAGIVVLLAVRGTSARATGSVLVHPIKSLAAGIGAVIVLPITVVLLSMTLVGIPLAIIGVLIAVALFIIGPLPAVTALGNRLLLRKGGLFGAFIAGAAVWRLGIWIIPVIGGLIYLLAMVWGIGGWVLGIAAARSAGTGSSPGLRGSDTPRNEGEREF